MAPAAVSVAADVNVDRPAADFAPSIWGDYFLDYTPDTKEVKGKKEREIKELENEAKEQLKVLAAKACEKPAELLSFIDNVERLGVAYRLAAEIEEALQTIFNSYVSGAILHQLKAVHGRDDLHLISLCFRLLRQHGFNASPDVFKIFKDDESKGFKESLVGDVQGMLSLYEASYVRVHGEVILDEALEFTSFHLKSINASELPHPLSSLLPRSLDVPLHLSMTRLESRHYISIYEQVPTHDKTLLRFAKLDFNYLQSMHKEELKDLSKWWKDLDMASKLPFVLRHRVTEGYFWTLGAFYEPQYALARKIFLQMFKVASIHDDVYDAHGTLPELELFLKAIERWDASCMNELPEYMKVIYQTILDTYKGFEDLLAAEERSHLVRYVIEETQDLSRVYLQEARWRHENYTPTYEEYMTKAAILSFGNNLAISTLFLGMGGVAIEDALKWVRGNPCVVEGSSKLGRIMNDMVSHKFERDRDHVHSAVECYMRQHGATKEETHMEFNKELDDIWRDINQATLRPTIIARPLLERILLLDRIVHLVYKDEDAYTFPENTMKDNISLILINPIPI